MNACYRWRKFKNALVQVITSACSLLVIAPLGLIFYHLLTSGLGAVNWDFFTRLPKPVGETGGGMANAIAGTFELLGLAALIGVPVGVFGGVFLSEYGAFRLNRWIRFGADVLNGVPSIIWGMVVPLIMRTTEEVLLLVPSGYREAALALGIAEWRTILQIVVRTALKGIITGVLLALARVAGETA